MSKIFISYRRADSLQAVGRIHDRLALEFGEGSVFMDIEGMKLGTDFRPQLRERLQDCKAVLAVIGSSWLTEEGKPSQYVTMELATALEQEDLPVIPVLLDGTQIPSADSLPEEIAELSHRSGINLYSNKTFGRQIDELIAALVEFDGIESVRKANNDESPRLSNFSYSRNTLFTGRTGELERLAQDLEKWPDQCCVQVVTGLGGIGKSQLVQEYARRHRDEYSIVWWIQAETEKGLEQSLALLAAELKLPQGVEEHPDEAARAAIRWLVAHDGWLLVFDNANSLDAVKDFLPPADHGHILITSRNPNWSGSVNLILQLQGFDRQDSIEFLLGSAGDKEREEAFQLAEILGDLPLALEQARAYIANRGISISKYREFFNSHGKQLLLTEESSSYPRSVATTYAIAMEEVLKNDPRAAVLANCLSLLAPEPVSMDFFAGLESQTDIEMEGSSLFELDDGQQKIPIIMDSFELVEAQASLRKYAIATVEDNTLTMHRMVQAVVRESMDAEELNSLIEQLVVCTEGVFRNSRPGSSARPNHLLHTEAVLQQSRELGVRSKSLASLLLRIGTMRLNEAKFKSSRDLLESALDIAGEFYGTDSKECLYVKCHLAASCEINEQEQAWELFDEVNSGINALRESNPEDAAFLLRVRSKYLQELAGPGMSSIDSALVALGQARSVYGDADIRLVEYLQLAAQAYHRNRDLQDALSLHEEAIHISESQKGKDDISVLSNLGCYGELLTDLHHFDEAEEVLKRSVEISKKHIGENSIEVAEYLVRLGESRLRSEKLDEAVEPFEKAIEILKGYPHVDPLLSHAYYRYAEIFYRRQDYEKLKELLKLALAANEDVYGVGSIHSLRFIEGLAHTYIDLGDAEAAEALIQEMDSVADNAEGHNQTIWKSRVLEQKAWLAKFHCDWRQAHELWRLYFMNIKDVSAQNIDNYIGEYFYSVARSYVDFTVNLVDEGLDKGLRPEEAIQFCETTSTDVISIDDYFYDLCAVLNGRVDLIKTHYMAT